LPDSDARGAAVRDRVAECAQQTTEEDMLVFYFSGHGVLRNGVPLLVPYDYDRNSPETSAISVDEIRTLLADTPARAKILILDACHAGPDIGLGNPQGKEATGLDSMPEGFLDRVFGQARGTAILSACVAKQQSWTYPDSGLSAFTHFLVHGLKGAADMDQKGFVTVSDAFHFVVDRVRRWAADQQLRQTPALTYTTTGEIVLTGTIG
jgi:uncharacterized caspase-like protein